MSPLDVLLEGEGVRRGVDVRCGQDALAVGDRSIPLEEVFWTSRRAGLLMVFAADRTLALQGRRERLDELADEMDGRIGGEGGRGRLPSRLTAEVVVCTAGVAVVGRLGGRRVKGLRVAVATRQAFHLLGGEEEERLSWPADEVGPAGSGGGEEGDGRDGREGSGREGLLLRRDDDELRIHYLFPEEIRTLTRLAREEPPPGPRVTAGAGEPLEMFARGEVAPPVASELPELRLSVDVLQTITEEATGGIPEPLLERAGMSAHFVETHVLELGEIALGPLLLRKSAAGVARSLERAVEAMDAEELRSDARAAVANATRRLIEAYDTELDRLLSDRRAPPRIEEEHRLTVEEREEMRLRLQAPVDRLVPRFRELEEQQDELLRRLRELASGPPDAEKGDVEAARREWGRALARTDRAFVRAWEEMAGEIASMWEERLLPSLAAVAGLRRRRIPEWAMLALLALATLLAAASAMILWIW